MAIKPPDYKYCPFCTAELQIKIEEDRERKYCPACGWKYFPSPGIAVAAVIVRGNKVLMVQRNRDPYKSTRMFPAGFVEYGESLSEALAREVKEETGLTVLKTDLICALQSRDDPRSPGHFVLFYLVVVEGEIENCDPDENQAVGWFKIAEPPTIGFPTHKFVMNSLQSKRRKK